MNSKTAIVLASGLLLASACSKEKADPLADYVSVEDPKCKVADCEYLERPDWRGDYEQDLRGPIANAPSSDCYIKMDKELSKNDGTATIHVMMDPARGRQHAKTEIVESTIANKELVECMANSVSMRAPWKIPQSQKMIAVVKLTVDLDPASVPDPEEEFAAFHSYLRTHGGEGTLEDILVELPDA